MMSETKEGQLDSYQNSFEEKHLQEYLDHAAKILGISSPNYCIKSGSKVGDNYIGIIYRIFIEGKKSGLPVKTQVIIKVPPQDEAVRLMLHVRYFFPREHLFYSEIVPLFKDFLTAKNKRLENLPECYFSSDVDKKEVICVEDLQVKGFVLRDRIKQLDFAHVSLALRALGRLHAISFALRDQRPEIFSSKIATLKEILYRPEVITDSAFIENFKECGDLVNTALGDEDPMYRIRFSKHMENALSHMGWSCDGSFAEPYAVLGHGDFSIINLLFKYDEDSSEPKDICILDFQLARYASPAVDVSYILFCSCSQAVRAKHYDELINIYHESLSTYLSELGSDPKKLFPYDALLAQLQKFSIHTAGMALRVLPGLTSQGQDSMRNESKKKGTTELQTRIHRDHFWRNTARDTFKDLIDRNYI